MAALLTPSDPVGLLVLAVLGLVGLFVAVRLVLAPTAAAALLVVVVVSNVSGVLGSVGPASAYLAALGIATLALLVGVVRGTVHLRFSPFFLLLGTFVAVRAASVLFAATDVAAGVSELTDEAKGIVLLVVLTLLVGGAPRPEKLVGLAVAGVAALAALTVVQEFVLGDGSSLGGLTGIGVESEVAGLGARHSGPLEDPNFWCRVLVLFLPLALALMWSRTERPLAAHRADERLQLRWAGAAALLLAGAYLSQSRGGMIAMFVTAVLTLGLFVRNRTRLLAGTAAFVMVLALLPGVGSRIATLGSLGSDSSTGVVDPSLRGREAAQKAGLAMFEGSPLIGVGAANFEVAGDRYQRELGISITEKKGLLAPHDIYVQQLAEGGVVGLLGYLVFYLGSLVLMFATRRRWRALHAVGLAGETEQRLSAAVATGLVGWGIASAFLHLATLPILLVLLSFGAALHLRARQLEEQSGLGDLLALPESHREPGPRGSGAGPSRTARTTLVLFAVAFSAGAGVALRTALDVYPGYTATVRVGISPTGTAGQGYAYSVLDRTRTVPTIIRLASDLDAPAAADIGMSRGDLRDARVTVARDSEGSSFRIRTTTRRADQAAPFAAAIAERLSGYLAAEQSLYGTRTLTTAPTTEAGSSRPARFVAAAGLGLLGVATLLAATRPAQRRRRTDGADEFAEPQGYAPV